MCVVSHDGEKEGTLLMEIGVLLHYLRPEATNPVGSCTSRKIEWKTRARDPDQSICCGGRTSECGGSSTSILVACTGSWYLLQVTPALTTSTSGRGLTCY